MSKSKADLAKLLSASNEQLFDRYVNIKLMQEPDRITKPGRQRFLDAENGLIYSKEFVGDFILVTPKTGIKPRISVTGHFIAEECVSSITVTIYNISEQIDTMAYNWAEIELGYINSGICTSFKGQITNCYMAKPNPNGELVVTVTCASLTDMYKRGSVRVEFDSDIVDFEELLRLSLNDIAHTLSPILKHRMYGSIFLESIPEEWKTHKFFVGKGSRFFRSGFEVITWLNSVFASYAYGTDYAWGAGEADMAAKNKLPPIKLGFDAQGWLNLTGSYAEAGPANIKALSAIGSAFLSGEEATVTAPFNPGIMPGDVIYIDVKYFKTRVNIEGQTREMYKSLGNHWFVVDVQFTFDTMTANMMTLRVNNITNKITASGVQE